MNLLPDQSLYNYMNCLKDKSCDSAKCERRWILSSLAIVVFGRLSNGIFGWQTVILLLINVGLLVVALKKVKGGYTQFANYFSFGGSWLAVSLATNFYAYHLYAKQAERPRVRVCIVTSLLLLLVVFGAGYEGEAGIGHTLLQTDEGIALVVLQKNVIAGLMALDKGVFQHQRLKFRAYENGVKPIHLRDHHPRFGVVGRAALEILADAVFQFFRLAHIDHKTRLVHHQVDTGHKRKGIGFFQQLLSVHGFHLLT